jgi:hypothetical protein
MALENPLTLKRGLILLLLVGGAILVARVWLFASGNVLVLDRHSVIDVAELRGSVEHRRLTRIGWLYFGIPSFDGSVWIRCESGATGEHGYVTSGSETRVKVSGACRLSDW